MGGTCSCCNVPVLLQRNDFGQSGQSYIIVAAYFGNHNTNHFHGSSCSQKYLVQDNFEPKASQNNDNDYKINGFINVSLVDVVQNSVIFVKNPEIVLSEFVYEEKLIFKCGQLF